MTKAPQTGTPTLGDLRNEIARSDEAMHTLLMERGEIIDRLIAVKGTQESGAAFRPAREAEMMRRLVQRHHGILPLDTAESIWRVIISTFTHVQAPFAVHADLERAMQSYRRLLPLFRLMEKYNVTRLARAIAPMVGLALGPHREPLLPLPPAETAEIRRVVDELRQG